MSELRVNNVSEVGGDAVISAGVLDSGSLPAGSIVDAQSVLKTDTFSSSVAAGANVAVTDLSITHTLKNASNKLLIMAYFGQAGNSAGLGGCGIAAADDGTLIGVGTGVGSRAAVGAGGFPTGNSNTVVAVMPHIHLVYSPGDTNSHTYTVRAINISTSTQTVYVNRAENDTDNLNNARAVSAITIQEVAG